MTGEPRQITLQLFLGSIRKIMELKSVFLKYDGSS